MNKNAYIPQLLIAVFLIIGGLALLSNTNFSGLNSITGFAIASASNVFINTTHGHNKTNENITLYWTSDDTDGDKVINITDWRLNGRSIMLINMPFENNSYSKFTTRDYSMNSNNGTVSGANWTKKGFIGGAYNFSNSNFNDTINLGVIIKSLPVTYGGWINFETFPCPGNGCTPITQDNSSANGFEIGTNALDELVCWDGTQGSSSFVPSVGVWYHVICRHTGSKMDLFINGVQIGVSKASTHLPTNTDFLIGPGSLYGSDGLYGFKGMVDEVVVYNRSLTDSQIFALYSNRTDLIVSQELSNNDTWSAAITPNDMADDGVTRYSNNITIHEHIAPIISNINYEVFNESAVLTWTTNESANATVQYGTTLGLGSSSSNTTFRTSQNVTVSDLLNYTLYYYNITACDFYGNCNVTETLNFTTLRNGCQYPPNSSEIHFSGTFCPGTYAGQTYTVKIDDFSLMCNNTILNGTNFFWVGTKNNMSIKNCRLPEGNITLNHPVPFYGVTTGLTLINNTFDNLEMGGASNVTIRNNTILPNSGILIDQIMNGGGSNVIINYNTIMCRSLVNSIGISLYGSIGGPKIYNNTIKNCGIGLKTFTKAPVAFNNGPSTVLVENNTFFGNTIGLKLELASFASGTVAHNNISNNDYGIMMDVGSYTLSQNNYRNSSKMDLNNTATGGNTIASLVLISGNNSIKITNKIVSIRHETDDVFIGNRIVAVNTSIESGLNVSAELIFVNITSVSTPDVYSLTRYETNPNTVISDGSICPVTTCTNKTYDSANHILKINVSGFSSYAVKTFSASTPEEGHHGGGATPPSVVLPPEPPCLPGQPCAPVSNNLPAEPPCLPGQICNLPAEPPCLPGQDCAANLPVPGAAALPLQTSLTENQFELSDISCEQGAKIQTIQSKVDFSRLIEPGYEILVSPFKLGCEGQTSRMTFSVPDNYKNVVALKCSESDCSKVDLNSAYRLDCGTPSFTDVKRKTSYLSPDLFPIKLTRSDINSGSNSLSSGRTRIIFVGEAKGRISMDVLFGPAPEAVNQRIRITGTPTVITFENKLDALAEQNITLPYIVPEHTDESSTAIYALKDNKWFYLGGDVDKINKTVTVKANVSDYLENNKLTIAPMAMICLNCFDSKLEKVYDGGSKDSVILVHGFENTPERFQDIIDDIKLTKQPWKVWVFGYPSNQPIEDTAKDMADLMQLEMKSSDYIYIAAHSMGGLVTQQALRYAYDQNKGSNDPPYTFLNKVVKVALVAVPNKGTVNQDPKSLLNSLINSDVLAGIFNVKSKIVQELISGKIIPRVPGIEYLVIAGTLPFEFTKFFGATETNDGLVSVSSAQDVGGILVDNRCHNFWEINVTHTDILNNFDSRKIIERIVASEINKDVTNKALLGHISYYDLNVPCNPADQYVIVGMPASKEEIPDPGMCSCGNGVCGLDENEVNCPSDCARIEAPRQSLLDLITKFKPLRNILLLLLLILIAIIILSRRREHGEYYTYIGEYPGYHPTIGENLVKQSTVTEVSGPKKEPVKEAKKAKIEKIPANISASEIENHLNQLIIQTRVNNRLGNKDRAAILYSQFSREYGSASEKIKDKFKDVYNKLKKEVA